MIRAAHSEINIVRNLHTLITVLISGALLLSLNNHAATELYQWVDENGVRHFSQQPPAHIPNLEAVDVHGAPVLSGGESQALDIASDSSQEEDPTPQKSEIERIENPVKSAVQCEQARKNIAQIQQYRRVKAEDPETGELRYLDDKEKETQLKNWQDREDTYC